VQFAGLVGEWIKRADVLPDADFAGTKTEITPAKWGLTYIGTLKNCIAGATAALVPECTATILLQSDAASATASFGMKYFQPKELQIKSMLDSQDSPQVR